MRLRAANDGKPPIYAWLEPGDVDKAARSIIDLAPNVEGVAIGTPFFVEYGPPGVRQSMHSLPELELFLDLKYHDIPNTVAAAVRAAIPLAPKIISLHAVGGAAMMRAAAAAIEHLSQRRPLLVAEITASCSVPRAPADNPRTGDGGAHQIRLMDMARASGMDGVLCNIAEITDLTRRNCRHLAIVADRREQEQTLGPHTLGISQTDRNSIEDVLIEIVSLSRLAGLDSVDTNEIGNI